MIYIVCAIVSGYLMLCCIERRIVVPGFFPLVVSAVLGLALESLFFYAVAAVAGYRLLPALVPPSVLLIIFAYAVVRGRLEVRKPARWGPVFESRTGALVFTAVVVAVLGMVAVLYRPLYAPWEERCMIAAFRQVPDVHKQVSFCGAAGTLSGGRMINPFIAGPRVSYYVFFYLSVYALHFFSKLPVNTAYVAMSLLVGFLFLSLLFLYVRRITGSEKGALAALGLMTLVGGVDVVAHRLAGRPPTMGLEGWHWASLWGITFLGGRIPLNWYCYVPQHLFGGSIALCVMFLVLSYPIDRVMVVLCALLITATWGASFYVAAPFHAGVAVYVIIRALKGFRRGGEGSAGETGALVWMLLLSLPLSALLIMASASIMRAERELGWGGVRQLLTVPFALFISYPLNLGALYLAGLYGAYRGWRDGLFANSPRWGFPLAVMITGLLLTSLPRTTIDWKDNGLLPAQIALAAFAGLACALPRHSRAAAFGGRAARAGAGFVLALLIAAGVLTTVTQFERLKVTQWIPKNYSLILAWLETTTAPGSRIAVFEGQDDNLSYWIPPLAHRSIPMDFDNGRTYSENSGTFWRVMQDFESMECNPNPASVHRLLRHYGVSYLIVRAGASGFDLFRAQGMENRIRGWFVPMADFGDYRIYRVGEPAAIGEDTGVTVSFSENVLPPLPSGAGEGGWRGCGDEGGEAGRAESSRSILFTERMKHCIETAAPLTIRGGETYLLELLLSAAADDEYSFSLTMEDVTGGKIIARRNYEGNGHERFRFTLVVTSGSDATVRARLRVVTSHPSKWVRLEGMSLRSIRLAARGPAPPPAR